MSRLLKTDLKRICKDKLLLVMGILAVVFAFLTPMLYLLLFSVGNMAGMTAEESAMMEEMLSGLVSAKNQFFASFSMTNNMGLIAPILLAIVLWKDFSFGTIRNKIITGNSRTSIFFSLFISCALVLVGVMLLQGFLSLGISLLFFEYQEEAFVLSDFFYFLASLGFEILVLLFVAALLSFLIANAKNVGLVVVLYVAVLFALMIVGSITQTAEPLLEMSGEGKNLLPILHFINRINIGNAAAYIGQGREYTLEDVLYLTLPALCGVGGLLGFGALRFNKKDLK